MTPTAYRNPSPVFAAIWSAWLVAVYVALTMPERPLVGLVVLLSFFTVELPAVVLTMPGNARDTLSEIATWLFSRLSKHKRPLRGWNACIVGGLVLPTCWLLMRTVGYYSESQVLAVGMAGLCCVFLLDHFQDPVTHG